MTLQCDDVTSNKSNNWGFHQSLGNTVTMETAAALTQCLKSDRRFSAFLQDKSDEYHRELREKFKSEDYSIVTNNVRPYLKDTTVIFETCVQYSSFIYKSFCTYK